MENNSNKRVAANAILNTFKTILGIVFPLITFPYVSRVLGAEKLGIYNFSASVVSYFILLSALGISTYGIREGTQYRDDKESINQFVSELFSINIISTVFSFLLLVFFVMVIPKFQSYAMSIMILSVEIIFTTIGVSWVCNIFEDFIYITIRSLIFQLISLVLTFTLVKKPEDIYFYIIIIVIANSGSNILNFFYIRKKYCKFKFSFIIDYKKHLRPIFIIFSTSIAVVIYVSSDTTMLGFITSDYYVGLYGTAVKIYNILKNVLVAILVVLIPRFSLYFARGEKEKSQEMFSQIFNLLTVIILPMTVGIFMISEDVIVLISGKEFIGASNSLRLLSLAVLFSLYSYMYTQCILIPCKKETIVFKATAISATVNVLLNFVLLPIWGINAAAMTTIIAEIITFVISYIYGRKELKVNGSVKNFISAFIGCFGIVIVCLLTKNLNAFCFRLLISIIASIIIYLIILILMKNESLITIKKLLHSPKKQN